MTAARIWTWVRWPIAIVALLLVVRYATPRALEALKGTIEFGAEEGSIFSAGDDEATETETPLDVVPEPVQTLEPPSGPAEDGATLASADFHVNDQIADVDAEALLIGDDEGDAIVVAYPLPQGDPSCLAGMSALLTIDDVASTTEIGVFLGNVPTADEVVDNQFVEGPLTLTEEPIQRILVESEGRLDIDVLAAYQSYFTQGLPPGSPFVLVVQATVPVELQGGLSMTALETETEAAPTLAWTAVPDCGGEGGATPTATPTL